MIRTLTALALVALACGGSAESPVARGLDVVEPPLHEAYPEPADYPAPAASPEYSHDAAPEASPRAAADAPAPTVEPVVQPEPPPATEPAPGNHEPEPQPEPDPTPESPLVIECDLAADCAACWADLRADHYEWFDTGAAMCEQRTCSTDAACAGVGDGLVCRADGGPSGAHGEPVCRAPRLPLNAACLVDEGRSNDGHAPLCEPGLWCRPFSVAGLRCRPYAEG